MHSRQAAHDDTVTVCTKTRTGLHSTDMCAAPGFTASHSLVPVMAWTNAAKEKTKTEMKEKEKEKKEKPPPFHPHHFASHEGGRPVAGHRLAAKLDEVYPAAPSYLTCASTT